MYVSPVVRDCSVVPKGQAPSKECWGNVYHSYSVDGLLEAMAFHLFFIVLLHIDPKEP